MKFDANFPESGIPAFHKISFRFLARRSRIPRPTPHVKTSPSGEVGRHRTEGKKNGNDDNNRTDYQCGHCFGLECGNGRQSSRLHGVRVPAVHARRTGLRLQRRNAERRSRQPPARAGKYYEAYDSDYEAYLWIGTDGHGKNGAPYHIKDIVSDMEAAEAMIDTLYETLKTALK